MRQQRKDCLSEEKEWDRKNKTKASVGKQGLNNERASVFAFCGFFGGEWEDREGECGRQKACYFGEACRHVVSCRIKIGEALTQDGGLYKEIKAIDYSNCRKNCKEL